jgi:hypothetical protein
MPFDFVQIFLVRMRQRAEQPHQLAASECGWAHWNDLAHRFAAAVHYKRLIAISHAIHDF